MGTRNLIDLEKSVAAIERAGLGNKLKLQLAMANRIIEQLKRIEKLRYVHIGMNNGDNILIGLFYMYTTNTVRRYYTYIVTFGYVYNVELKLHMTQLTLFLYRIQLLTSMLL